MNTRAFTLALILAGFAMFMVYTYIEDQKTVIIKKYGTPVTVVIAKKDINELELIDDSKVGVKTVPRSFAQPGSFKTIKDLENTIATIPIIKGEQITKPRVTYPGAKTGLGRQVSVGKRALAINITDKTAVSKLIKPGDRVDILSAIDYSLGQKDKQKVKTILQDVLVLSAGFSMTNSLPIYGKAYPKVIKKMQANVYEAYNTITVEVTPYQAQKMIYLLTWAGQQPFLALRNNNDKKIVRIKGTDIFDVIGEEDRAEAKEFFKVKYKKSGGR